MDSKAILAHPTVIATGWAQSERPVFVMFGADWCSFCVKQKPVVEALKAEYGDQVQFEILDSDEAVDLKKAFGLSGIPACFILGKHLDGIEWTKGYQAKSVLKRKIDKALSAKKD